MRKAIGTQGSWFAKLGEDNLPCLLNVWLSGLAYHDPHAKIGEPRWEEYVAGVREGKVILTQNEAVTYARKGYIGVFSVENVVFDKDGLKLTITDRLESLQ